MDVIFDIDGTLADASHRLHFIKDMRYWTQSPSNPEGVPKPDWESFLSDEQVSKDAPISQTWALLETMLYDQENFRVIFITGRNESTREMTLDWLTKQNCPFRGNSAHRWEYRKRSGGMTGPVVYMRSVGDRRPSDAVKRDLLNKARADGFNPTLVFEDRKDDTAMWRSEGLLCCQVAEGDY